MVLALCLQPPTNSFSWLPAEMKHSEELEQAEEFKDRLLSFLGVRR